MFAASLGQSAFSRAYLNIPNQQDIIIFREKFDGYIFIDSKGKHFQLYLHVLYWKMQGESASFWYHTF